ncbi:MAG: efflux RND transporter periplasmic adaptor subunit [Pseudomonadota bacterium]
MKAHQYAAVVVLVLTGAWVITGDFSYVGSAASQDPQTQTQNVAADENTESAEDAVPARALQRVSVAQIPQVQHARTVRVSGVTEADKTTQLTARESGVIGTMPVSQGDLVSEGDLIAQLDLEGRDAMVVSAEAQLKRRRAELDARAELVRRGTFPRLQLEELISGLAEAEADLATMKAEIDRLDVTAPFDGVVDVINVELGSAVQPGVAVGTLIALDPIIGVGEINEQDLPIIEVGSQADLRLVSGETVTGTVRYISREANPATRTFTVEVEVPNPSLTIPSGMTAEIVLRGKPVLATPAPRSIITLDARGNLGVRTVGDDNEVVFHPIDIVDDSSGALILGGIPEGARVIVAGQNIVSDGQTVEPTPVEQDVIDTLIEEVRSEVASQ